LPLFGFGAGAGAEASLSPEPDEVLAFFVPPLLDA
jgi:hypothetical protein